MSTPIDVRAGRYVVTYTPGEWPAGVLTGYDDEAGGWHLEHVIAFDRNGGTLRALLRHGLAEAWARDYHYVTFHIPHAFPLHGALAAIGGGLGFKEYSRDERHVYYVYHRPQAAEARGGAGAGALSSLPSHMAGASGRALHDGARDAGG